MNRYTLVQQAADYFRILSDPTRLNLIHLVACQGEDFCVGEMAEKLEITPSAVSQHLRLLRGAGIVRSERRGNKMFYYIVEEKIQELVPMCQDLTLGVFQPCRFPGKCKDCKESLD